MINKLQKLEIQSLKTFECIKKHCPENEHLVTDLQKKIKKIMDSFKLNISVEQVKKKILQFKKVIKETKKQKKYKEFVECECKNCYIHIKKTVDLSKLFHKGLDNNILSSNKKDSEKSSLINFSKFYKQLISSQEKETKECLKIIKRNPRIKPKSITKSNPRTKPKSKPKPRTKPKSKPKPRTKPITKSKTKPKSITKSKIKPKPKSKTKPKIYY